MSPRELILLTPYRFPGRNTLSLSPDDVAAWLNGWSALWHPAALAGASGPPRTAPSYDHEQPTPGHVYAIPESPPLILPDDWDQRVKDAGAVAFRATADRETTLANLREALATDHWPLTTAQVRPFLGVGLGYLVVETLYEAMEHENMLAAAELWQEVQQAVAALSDPDPEAFRRPLQLAAERLLAAREVLYPVTIYLIDLCLLDEKNAGEPLPAGFEQSGGFNLVAAASVLEKLAREQPDRMAVLRERVQAEQVEVCGGSYLEREDALLPVESQLWNLLKGAKISTELLGTELRVFARKRFAFHPQLPLFLQGVGLTRAVLLSFDNGVVPAHRGVAVSWPSPDGKQVEAFTRKPFPAADASTFFHLAHSLHQTIMEDHRATFGLLHDGKPAFPWYEDWLELSRLAPVLGQWTTLSRYFSEGSGGDYTPAASADDFHDDYLEERTTGAVVSGQWSVASEEGRAGNTAPVSGFARQLRLRRRVDTAWALLALYRGLTGKVASPDLESRLTALEDHMEGGADPGTGLAEVEKEAAQALADRLVSRAQHSQPGYLVLNPCSFARRVALELPGLAGPLRIEGPLKAGQFDADKARLVVEVPALGFAWFPASAPPGTPPPPPRMVLASKSGNAPAQLRNEFFEVEVDPATGGLRAIRDHRTRMNRLGQQLVWNPGSAIRVKEVRVTSAGPALGEVVSEGALIDDQEQVLATFRQRFRVWLGRPVLEMRIEIFPEHIPTGYPWHSYYGARFAWRDERALLLRGVNGTGSISSHTRPESPSYLEFRLGKQSTSLFTGGLPFHQRQGTRMLDVILLPEGETAHAFDLAIGLDREQPMQTALGMVTPAPVVATAKGPPHVGASGWLFHLDAPNLMLASLRPAPDGADAIVARMLECANHGGQAEFRCARDPRRAGTQDARGIPLIDMNVIGDAAEFDFSPGDLVQLRIEFG